MSTKYQMWLTYNAEKEKIQLPVLPESFEVNNGSNNESMNITGLGEIVIMQSRPALQFSWSCFFPATKFPGLQVSKITDVYATIEEFTYSEEGGDPGTYQYSIKLKEYREITVRQVKVNIPKATATVKKETPRVNNSAQPKTYTVKSGDCLWNIAKKFYGNGAQYTKIYNANKGVIGGNPNLIYPGQVLTIP